ncbi:MAG: hypothetical protein R2705_06040 [Ilumatobacteraceae bacterium]
MEFRPEPAASATLVPSERQLRKLRRAERGPMSKWRMNKLGRTLDERGPMAIRHNSWGVFGDRARLELDDGTLLRMWLLSPRDGALAALVHLVWNDAIGWIVQARGAADGRRTSTPTRCCSTPSPPEPERLQLSTDFMTRSTIPGFSD